ncbi:MAG: hypothetical protein V7765_21135, partial [Oleispira sp.]
HQQLRVNSQGGLTRLLLLAILLEIVQLRSNQMTNEMKLLTALCDALGFEVEKVEDIKHLYNRKDCFPSGEPKIGAMPSSIINITDYKLTKKRAEVIKCNKCGTRIGNGLPLDSCMCKSSANLVRVKV